MLDPQRFMDFIVLPVVVGEDFPPQIKHLADKVGVDIAIIAATEHAVKIPVTELRGYTRDAIDQIIYISRESANISVVEFSWGEKIRVGVQFEEMLNGIDFFKLIPFIEPEDLPEQKRPRGRPKKVNNQIKK